MKVFDVVCNVCGKHLFFEEEALINGAHGRVRHDDNGNYIYDELKGEFYCNECVAKREKFEITPDDEKIRAEKFRELIQYGTVKGEFHGRDGNGKFVDVRVICYKGQNWWTKTENNKVIEIFLL